MVLCRVFVAVDSGKLRSNGGKHREKWADRRIRQGETKEHGDREEENPKNLPVP